MRNLSFLVVFLFSWNSHAFLFQKSFDDCAFFRFTDPAHKKTYSKEELETIRQSWKHPQIQNLPAFNGVEIRPFYYWTRDEKRQLVLASAAVYVPLEKKPSHSYEVLSLQHGTEVMDDFVPSNLEKFPHHSFQAALFASRGFIVIAADYLGFGVSPGLHPYLHEPSQSEVTYDALVVGMKYANGLGFQTSSSVFLAGYSQGGHVTMGLHRKIESETRAKCGKRVSVKASFPMAGPYDLSDTTVELALKNPSERTSVFATYLLLAYQKVYGLYRSVDEPFQKNYGYLAASLFDGQTLFSTIQKSLPENPTELLDSRFYQDLISNPDSKFRKTLRKNNVYDWTPKSKVVLFHGTKDLDVPTQNSIKTYQIMSSRGADVSYVDVGPLDHIQASGPSMIGASLLIEKIRN